MIIWDGSPPIDTSPDVDHESNNDLALNDPSTLPFEKYAFNLDMSLSF